MKHPASLQPNTRTPFVIIMIVCAFAGGLVLGTSGLLNKSLVTTDTQAPFNTEYLTQIYERVEQDYLGELPNAETITQSMAKGLLESLNDPYSAYLNPSEAAEYMKMSDSAYDGIGVQLGFNEQYTTIQTVMDGFPGQQAGLKSGDLVLSVDGEDMTNVRPEIVAGKIKGVAGTNVKLSIYRESESQILDFTITRAEIQLDNITYEKLDNGVVIVHVGRFTDGARDGLSGVEVFKRDWDQTVDEIAALNPAAIIVDLRNNPGGYVEGVKHVAEEFLADGSILMREQQNNQPEVTYRDNRRGAFESVPVAVLVNEGSASASEIFSGAISDNGRGKIIGMKTVGKGVEQELLPLSDDSILLLVFRKWLTPSGRQISADNPITPDEVVEYAPAANGQKYDTQVTKAWELLTK